MPSKSRRNRRQRQGGGSGEGGEAAPRRERTPRPKTRSRRRSEASRGVYVVAGVAVAVVALVGFVLVQVSRGAGTASDFEFSVYQGEEVLGGTNINFGDLLDGPKPVVLNFWAGDCPPCRAEMPALQRVYDKHREDIIFLGLDVGVFSGLGTRASGLALLDELNITYPAGAPPSRTPMVNYSVVSMPTTIFFGADGDIFQRWDGAIQEGQMNDIVEAMLDAT